MKTVVFSVKTGVKQTVDGYVKAFSMGFRWSPYASRRVVK
jgi:hypothetical protein